MTDKCDRPPEVADNLPRDATGEVIPFDAKTVWLKNGSCHSVSWFTYMAGHWTMGIRGLSPVETTFVYLDEPGCSDSWERLLGDLGALSGLCASRECENCGWYHARNVSCESVEDVARETARRIRALRGEDE